MQADLDLGPFASGSGETWSTGLHEAQLMLYFDVLSSPVSQMPPTGQTPGRGRRWWTTDSAISLFQGDGTPATVARLPSLSSLSPAFLLSVEEPAISSKSHPFL